MPPSVRLYFVKEVIFDYFKSSFNAMTETNNLSSLEKPILGVDQPDNVEIVSPLRRGELCPHCKKAQLDYNNLLQLTCLACGFVNGEGGGCT